MINLWALFARDYSYYVVVQIDKAKIKRTILRKTETTLGPIYRFKENTKIKLSNIDLDIEEIISFDKSAVAETFYNFVF